MTSEVFVKKMTTLAKATNLDAVSEEERLGTLEVIKEFAQDLVNELIEVINTKASNHTISIVIEVLKQFIEDLEKNETTESKMLGMVFKLAFSRSTETVTIPCLIDIDEEDDK